MGVVIDRRWLEERIGAIEAELHHLKLSRDESKWLVVASHADGIVASARAIGRAIDNGRHLDW